MKDETISITQLCKNIGLTEPGARKNITSNKQEYIKQGYITINETIKQGQKMEQIAITNKGLEYFISKYPLKEAEQKQIAPDEHEKTIKKQPKDNLETTENNKYIEILEQTIKDLKQENKRLNDKIDLYQDQQKQDREQITNQFNQLFETNKKLADNMQGLLEYMHNQPKQLAGEVVQEPLEQSETPKKQGLFKRLFNKNN